MSVSPERKFVTVARILRARGNKGEVAAELLTDFPERLPEIKEMSLRAESGARHGVVLREFWVDRNHSGKGVFHFEGVDSINEAEKLRGMEVQIPFEQRVSPKRYILHPLQRDRDERRNDERVEDDRRQYCGGRRMKIHNVHGFDPWKGAGE